MKALALYTCRSLVCILRYDVKSEDQHKSFDRLTDQTFADAKETLAKRLRLITICAKC